MAPRDPSTDEEPNYEDEFWEGPRTAIIGGGKTAEEAVEILRQAWKAKHDRDVALWTEHMRLEQEAALVAREEPGVAVIPVAELPEKPSQPDWAGLPLTPGFLDLKPARHVLKRLEKKEFIELWHFTPSENSARAGARLIDFPRTWLRLG